MHNKPEIQEVYLINKSKNPDPMYATDGSAGFDLQANIEGSIVLEPMERVLVGTGLFVQFPPTVELQIRPRSGLAIKHGITVLNAPGTIDSDYRGEIGVVLINLNKSPYLINPGDKIAQGVFARPLRGEWVKKDSLDESARGAGGFGHTGV